MVLGPSFPSISRGGIAPKIFKLFCKALTPSLDELLSIRVSCSDKFCRLFSIVLPSFAGDSAPVPQDNHAYTLTKVDQAGENTITKYEWSETENKLVPVYYRVDLNKTEYGNPNGDTTLTYGWKKNTSTNNLEFKKNPSTHVEPTITYKYNSSDNIFPLYQRNVRRQ